jgi:hypothetical protein
MKLSSRLHRQIEIKIRRAIAADTKGQETALLPEPNAPAKPEAPASSGSR